MSNFWRTFLSKKNETSKKNSIFDDISIANANVSYLAERIEFFLPYFKEAVPLVNRLYYIVAWATFISTLGILYSGIHTFGDFLTTFIREFMKTSVTATISLAVVDSLRPMLKSISTWQACIYTCLIIGMASTFSTSIFTVLFSVYFNIELTLADLAFKLLLNLAITIGIAIFLLIYYLSSYWQLVALVEAFEIRLAAQNELLKARMSPHFFFNTINGLTSLVETSPQKASEMLTNISTLFRASFDEATEISFEQEVELCQVFLHIDEMRFQGKLNITWDLPDEDTMYDMTITTLTLQSVLEKLLHHVVEITTETIDVLIRVAWEHHMVKIDILVNLPKKTLLVRHDLIHQMNFIVQEQRLKKYFGEDSFIESIIDGHSIKISTQYPLHDPGMLVTHTTNNFDFTI